jgi:hypothetical protein
MIPDPYRKTLRVPVRFKNGQWELFHGGNLPRIKEGTVADLVIEAHSFEDTREARLLEVDETVTILGKGATLMARISLDYCDHVSGLIELLKVEPPLALRASFLEIQLKDDLTMNLTLGKQARLNDCPCLLPTLQIEARSLNHAYTLGSRHYETRRRSNGGSVFLCVYFEDNGVWRPLASLRTEYEARFETEIAKKNTAQ